MTDQLIQGPDPIALGVKITSVLETGRRESTYKLATLMALAQYAVENARLDEALEVELLVLAEYVTDLYSRQLEPFDQFGPLRQGKGQRDSVLELLAKASKKRGLATPEARRLAQLLAQMPLTHLQHGEAGRSKEMFLFDDSWLHKKITIRELDARQWRITLMPGVGSSLAKLSGLLIPVLQMLWQQEVRRFNGSRVDEDRLSSYLFGSSRAATQGLRAALTEIQWGRCFYCGDVLKVPGEVEHVLPWSRTALDDLCNLVVADARCNADKAALIPVPAWVAAAVERDLSGIEQLGSFRQSPRRVASTAQGLYRWSPPGVPLWANRGHLETLSPLWVTQADELLDP